MVKRILFSLVLLCALLASACAAPAQSSAPQPSASGAPVSHAPANPEPSSVQPGPSSSPTVSSEPEPAAEPAGETLGRAAADYYERKTGRRPPAFEVSENGDGTWTIHLFETVDDGNGASHTATWAWYTVDAEGVGTDDIMGDAVDLRA